jgi:hypothetical protein
MGERIEINSTKSQIEEFKESLIWKDIVCEIKNWLEGFEFEHDSVIEDTADNNSSTANVLLHLGDLHGRKKAMMYVLAIPDVFIGILETRNRNKDSELDNEPTNGG